MRGEDLEAHLPGSPRGTPRVPPPSGLGLRQPITYINSERSLGPSAGPRPTSVPHANPLAPDGGWEGWPCVGDPGARLLTSPSPSPRSQPLVSHSPPIHHYHPSQKIRPCLALAAVGLRPPPPPRPPRGPHRVPAPPALILSSSNSHSCARLTAEATGPGRPRRCRARSRGTPETESSQPSQAAVSRDRAGSEKAAALWRA